jgi:tRNA A-37 threonylcarbamoyl transferase component Bud32
MRQLRRWIRVTMMAAATTAWAQHYPILPMPGAPHGIFTLMQDSHSAIWVGTIDEVFRFDGEHFYSLRPYGFPKETPNSFAEDSDGGIWIATQGTDANGGTVAGGLYRYKAGRVEKIFAADGLTIMPLAPGVMIAAIGTEVNGKPSYGDLDLFRESDGKWTAETLLRKQADHLTFDHQGNVLFPCPGGWCEIARKQLLEWRSSASKFDVQHHAGSPLIERVLRDRYGCMWFRAEPFASYQCPADPQPILMPKSISQFDVSAHLEEAPDGSILTLVPLVLGRPGAFHAATGSNGIPEPIDTAMMAKDGTIWIGAETGLYRFTYPFKLEYWDKEDGIGSPFSILREGSSILASSVGILRLNDGRGRWNLIPGTEGLGGILAAGPRDTFFAATRDLLTQFSTDGKVIARLPIANSLGAGAFLARAKNGDMWLGQDGIFKVIDQGKRFSMQAENLPSERVPERILDMQYDKLHDIVWACDGNDVAFHKGGVWKRITQKDGLLGQTCNSIGIQQNGDVWVGYRINAVSWIADAASGHPVIKNYTQWVNDVVENSGAHFLSADARDRLWLGSEVLRVATPEAAKAGEWIKLDERDGLSPPWVDGRPFMSDADGSVWFGTTTGAVHFSPPEDFASRFPTPPVFIAGFTVGQGAPILGDTIGSIARNANVVAHIGSMQFDRRNALHIRYRMLPEQTLWTDSNDTNLQLGKLRWGSHTLQVQAQLATGPWSPIAEQPLHVPWPFWLSWPFLLGLSVCVGGVVVGGRRWRKKRRARAKKAFPELAEWRLAAFSPELQQLNGTLLDSRFEIGRVLARGGFATVVEGRDLKEGGRACAVKIFRQELIDKEWMERRFRQEVLALATIHHPNVVRIFGHGTTPGGSPYLVMEFVDGKTLRQVLEEGKLTPQLTACYLRQTGIALDEIHAHAVCHRDLKPENLMIRNESAAGEELVLIDFSIAIVKDPDETLHGLSRAAGTLYYMAPEQAIGYADSSTDIYSLAKIVLEMMTGQRLSTLLPDASMDLPARVRELLSGLPVPLSPPAIDLLSSALEFDPSRRPKVAGEFSSVIARDLESVEIAD